MQFLRQIQQTLEDLYGAKTGLDVTEFVRPFAARRRKGELLVEQGNPGGDINLALLLDRDILSAWSAGQDPEQSDSYSVPFEEVSHFVYLAFNHNRGRNVTQLEMEIQAEVDRILVAFHGYRPVAERHAHHMLRELIESPYPQSHYEEARVTSLRFIRRLAGGDPRAWSRQDFQKLRDFFHTDLAGKLRLAKLR